MLTKNQLLTRTISFPKSFVFTKDRFNCVTPKK